jgi:hypothetical protein
MGGSKSSSSAKPVFFEGQMDAASQAIFDILLPQLYGGPNAALERGVQRGQANTSRVLAQRGLTGSGLEARALADVAAGGEEARQGQQFDLLNRLMSNAGNASRSSSIGIDSGKSDERLKTGIHSIDGPFEAIGLTSVGWTWKVCAKEFGLTGIAEGVIAQEVQGVYPDAVVTCPDGYYAVDYGYLANLYYRVSHADNGGGSVAAGK